MIAGAAHRAGLAGRKSARQLGCKPRLAPVCEGRGDGLRLGLGAHRGHSRRRRSLHFVFQHGQRSLALRCLAQWRKVDVLER